MEQSKLEHKYVLWVTQVNRRPQPGVADPRAASNWLDEVKPIAKFETVRMLSSLLS
jgi:hypothetical protein